MAEEAGASGSRSYRDSLLSTDSQPRSFSDPCLRGEDDRGRLPVRHDLRPASLNPLRTPGTIIARPPPPRLDFGQPIRASSSGVSVLGSSDRLRPLTPMHHPKSPSRAAFTLSPASLELGSPRLLGTNDRGDRPSSISGHSPHSRKLSNPNSRPGTPHPHGKPSVKHLTCFWWKEKGDCRFKEEDCLYAHHDTGLYADPPRQVVPGGEFPIPQVSLPSILTPGSESPPKRYLLTRTLTEPAMAGRSLDRALKKLHSDQNKSSSSLKSMSSDIIVRTDLVSRPGTPGFEPPMSPALSEHLKGIEGAYAAAASDNAFLRNLVEQGTREKAVFITTVENLQVESKTIKEENNHLKAEQAQLKAEREALRAAISKLQMQKTKQQQPLPTTNPFGAIGSDSHGQNTQLGAMLRNLGGSF